MIEIREEPATQATLLEHVKVFIAFLVYSIYRVTTIHNTLGGWSLSEESMARPWLKNYDVPATHAPPAWAERWDTSNWAILAAFDGSKRIGGAVVAFRTPGSFILEGRPDMVALWDIRVDPAYRRKGVGSLLFPAVMA